METISNIFHYTYGGPELFVLFFAFIVAPIVFYLLNKLLKKGLSAAVSVFVVVASIFVAYTDVYFIAKEAERLCREEAGIKVYKNTNIRGLVGLVDIDRLSKYGIEYTEDLYQHKKTRFYIKDGEVQHEVIPDYTAQYQYSGDSRSLDIPINVHRKFVKHRMNNEILAEIVSFGVYPGWLDSRLLGLLGFSWSPLSCDGNYLPEKQKKTLYYYDLIEAIVK